MKAELIRLQKELTKINAPYPKDNLITSYKDILKYRDYLPFYKFNPSVFEALIKVSKDTWGTKERIDRLSIITLIKRYGYMSDEKVSYFMFLKIKNPSNHLKSDLFHLYKRCFEEETPLTKRQLDEAKRTCNSMLFQLPLNDDNIEWLCANAFKDNMILNRVLKYPVKSCIITSWAKNHFNHPQLHSRRAELISWLIDEDLDFSISREILNNDFESLNSIDKKSIEDFLEDQELVKLMNVKAKDFSDDLFAYDDLSNDIEKFNISNPILKQTRRFHDVFYNHQIKDSQSRTAYDFEVMSIYFYDNLTSYTSRIMLWSIYYSRIEQKQKERLLKNYYSKENYHSFMKIIQRLKMTSLMKWLIKQPHLLPDENKTIYPKIDNDMF